MIPNRRLLVVYSAPYFGYVIIASLLHNYIPIEMNYILRIIIVTILFLWARRWYFSLNGPNSTFISVIIGAIAGLLGLFLWISLLGPFVKGGYEQPWGNSAFILRLISAGFLVPIFEEILMRGFILRFALQWDNARQDNEKEPLQVTLDERSVNNVEQGAWSWKAVVISTIAFASGHHMQEWLASIAFGLLMSWLWILRKDLISCIVAHSVTNLNQ